LLGLSVDAATAEPATHEPGQPAPVAWELARPDDPDVPPVQHRLLRAISQRIQRRAQLAAARERAGPPEPANVSASQPADRPEED
jgi:hypothetical protein